MAKRFGGAYSPNGANQVDVKANVGKGGTGDAPAKIGYGLRRMLLTLPPGLIAIKSFFSGAGGLALYLGAAAILFLALWLLREGLRAEAAYEAREVANRPAIPRKIFAAFLWGAGLGLAILAQGALLPAILVGTIAAVLHLAAFGIDPMRAKGMDRVDARDYQRADRVLTEARAQVSHLRDIAAKIRDRHVEEALTDFAKTAQTMIERLQEDPRDVRSARKFLSVYLESAVNASMGYAALEAKTKDPAEKASYIALLHDLNANFAQKTEKFIENDKADLNVEMEVLKDRLARENLVDRQES